MRRGFTLLELSIVLVLIALVLGGGMVVMTGYLQASQFNVTVARMDTIEKALLDYSVSNNRIPCPSDLAQLPSSAYYGVEAATPGTCSGGTPAATFKATSGTVEGGVPTRTLRLPDDYLYDGWGRRIRYAVDPTYTNATTSPLPVTTACSLSPTANTTAITVNDATGAARSSMAAYVLLSHGANGHGAYTSNGVMVNAGSANANEQTNCHCNSSAVSNATYTPTYVQMAPTTDPSSTVDNFDDIVAYKDAWELQKPNAQVTAASCGYVYVPNSNGSTDQSVIKFDLSGNFIARLPCGSSSSCANGCSSTAISGPAGVAVDSSGNVFVADMFCNRIAKFSSTGTYISQFPCASGQCSGSSAAGQLNYPRDLAIDKSGNIWVVDRNNYRVEEFTSAGTYAGVTFGSQGTGQGQFTTPQALATDSSGNIWVGDEANNNVQEFSNTGTWLRQLGGCSSGACSASGNNGSFNNGAEGVAIDASGNIWVGDMYSGRVQEFSGSTYAYIGQVGCTTGNCGWNTGNGQFKGPMGVAIDSSGFLWVEDYQDARVQKLSTAGTWQLTLPTSYFNPGSMLGIGTGSR